MEFLLLVLGAGIYFLPGITASSRGNPASGGVWVLNIFLGWTLLGWVVALAWAFSSKRMATSAGGDEIVLTGTELKNADGTPRAEIIAHLATGSRLVFTEDTENPHDSGAIAVHAASGMIGFIPPAREALRQAIRAGDYKAATIESMRHVDGVPRVSIRPVRRKAESLYERMIWFFVDGGAGRVASVGAALAIVAFIVYAANYQSRTPSPASTSYRGPGAADIAAARQTPVVRNWSEQTSRSAIDDTPIVALTTRALGRPTGSYNRELEIRLVLRCANNTTNLFLQVDDYTGIDVLPVTFRVDSNPAFNRNLTPSSGREALGLWTGRDAIPVIRELLDSERLTVRYVLPGEDPQTVRFNTSDLETRIRALRTACNW